MSRWRMVRLYSIVGFAVWTNVHIVTNENRKPFTSVDKSITKVYVCDFKLEL